MKLGKDPRKKYFSKKFTEKLLKLDETLNSSKNLEILTSGSGGKIQTKRKTNKRKKRKKRTKTCRVIHRNLILFVLKITQTEGDKFINDNNKTAKASNTFLANKKMLRFVAITMICSTLALTSTFNYFWKTI